MNAAIATLSNTIGNMLASAWFLFLHGGWLLVGLLLLAALYKIYMNEVQDFYMSKADPVLLQIKVQRDNLQSTLAVEQIFAQMHAIYTGFTFAETYLEGKINYVVSLEVASIGGKISYFVRVPRRHIGLIESSFYARYPSAEITEVVDYMAQIGPWKPDGAWDVWGTELKFIKDNAYPIRTYTSFEHPAAEESVIDPLTALIEALNKVEQHELVAIQILLRPIADSEWAPHAIKLSKKLKKEFMEGVLGDPGQDEEEQKRGGSLTSGERAIIEAIEEKAAKPGYQTKIRMIHIAPTGRLEGSRKTPIIGAFRQFSDANLNGLKPDTNLTWTTHNYILMRGLEQPYLDFKTETKKARMVKAFTERSMWLGIPPMIMNTEELATLYHFPLGQPGAQSTVENITVRKGQPPADLPMMS